MKKEQHRTPDGRTVLAYGDRYFAESGQLDADVPGDKHLSVTDVAPETDADGVKYNFASIRGIAVLFRAVEHRCKSGGECGTTDDPAPETVREIVMDYWDCPVASKTLDDVA